MARKRKPADIAAAKKAVAERLLMQIQKERESVADDISFLLSSAGVESSSGSLPFDSDSLGAVEASYWRLVGVSDEEMIATYERKMAIFLGECMIRLYGGTWVAYEGSEIVYSPIVVKMGKTGHHHDVFLLCTDLRRKPQVLGQRQRRALRNFLKSASHAGFA